ncbi:MAG: hypothetical protein AB7O88_05215 [Reyranellaceae bacterium]
MAKLKISRLVMNRSTLEKLPDDVRSEFLLATHILNEIETLRRLAVFSKSRSRNHVIQQIERGRYFTIVRLLIGKTVEGYEATRMHIVEKPSWKRQRQQISQTGRDAIDKAKKLFGKSSVLNKVRNNHCFHYPEPSRIAAGFARLEPEQDCSMYTDDATTRHCSYAVGADVVLLWTLINDVQDWWKDKPERQKDPLTEMSAEALDAADHVVTFLEQFAIMVLEQNPDALGDVLPDVTVIRDAPLFDHVHIPSVTRPPKKVYREH